MGGGRPGRPVGRAEAVSWQFPSSLLRTLGLAVLLLERAYLCPLAWSILGHVAPHSPPDRCTPLPAARGPQELIPVA